VNVSDQQPRPEPSFEYQKWIHELKRRDAERAHDQASDFSMKINQAAMDSGNIALRTGVLINGGAALSVLAFVGGLIAQGKIAIGPALVEIASALVWFAIGVAAATLAMGFAYFTNFCIAGHSSRMERSWDHPYLKETPFSKKWQCAAYTFQIVAVVLGFITMGLFVKGMIEVRDAISHLH
jgi:hypothetical protein